MAGSWRTPTVGQGGLCVCAGCEGTAAGQTEGSWQALEGEADARADPSPSFGEGGGGEGRQADT